MEQAFTVLAFVAFLVALSWLLRGSNQRKWSPLWLAFTTTAAAAVFLVSGSIGYSLDRRTRFFAGAEWADTVLWWEVGVGVALVPLALYFWRLGLRDIDARLQRAPSARR
jgi:hypothetical protein